MATAKDRAAEQRGTTCAVVHQWRKGLGLVQSTGPVGKSPFCGRADTNEADETGQPEKKARPASQQTDPMEADTEAPAVDPESGTASDPAAASELRSSPAPAKGAPAADGPAGVSCALLLLCLCCRAAYRICTGADFCIVLTLQGPPATNQLTRSETTGQTWSTSKTLSDCSLHCCGEAV